MPIPDAPHLRPVQGRELIDLFTSGYKDRIYPALVAPGPAAARARLENYFGVVPGRTGSDYFGLVQLRARIREVGHHLAQPVQNGLLITAPHTHWISPNPILISRTRDGYLVEESCPSAGDLYFPVSYVFWRGEALAYEWLHQPQSEIQNQFEILWAAISILATVGDTVLGHFGLSVNYRFKNPLEPRLISTAEYQPGSDESRTGPALIVPVERFAAEYDLLSLEQVAWHSFTDADIGIAPNDTDLANNARALLEKVTDPTILMTVRSQLELIYGVSVHKH